MARAKKKALDPLDALAQGDPKDVIALMLWKNRMREPSMYVQIDEHDIKGLQDCVNYLEVTPHVMISHPEGLPAQEAIPASRGRSAMPARPAQPSKPYVIVTLVDKDGNMITPVENNERDYDAAQDATRLRKARDQAADLSSRIMQQARTGEFSMSDLQDLCEHHMLLAGAV